MPHTTPAKVQPLKKVALCCWCSCYQVTKPLRSEPLSSDTRPCLEAVNLDEVLLNQALLCQELQDVLALIALQLNDLA